jgi:uncharacterized protein YdaU (DUF1376 family)
LKAPAFQFYAGDYLADESVQLMTLEEEGIYIRLLAYCWREGSIPADVESLARLCKDADRALMTRPMACFLASKKETGRLIHPRLEEERKKQKFYRDSRASIGRVGGIRRAEQMSEARSKADHTAGEWVEMKLFFGECVRCGSTTKICKDHVVPFYRGGSNGVANLQPLCAVCLSAKGAETADYRAQWCEKRGKQMPGKWLGRAMENARQNEAPPSSTASSFTKMSPPAGRAVSPKSAAEVKALAARFPVTSSVPQKPDDGFCEWWFEEQEKCGWTDPRSGRAWHDWTAAFNAAWRASTHHALRRKSRGGGPPQPSRLAQPQYSADDNEL